MIPTTTKGIKRRSEIEDKKERESWKKRETALKGCSLKNQTARPSVE
jgi:hypothetical protein